MSKINAPSLFISANREKLFPDNLKRKNWNGSLATYLSLSYNIFNIYSTKLILVILHNLNLKIIIQIQRVLF